MLQKTIVLAGANGNLGHQIAKYLIQKDVLVKLIVRKNSDTTKLEHLRLKGAKIIKLDYDNKKAISQACEGAHCVV